MKGKCDMNYASFKRFATEYIKEKHGTLSVLDKYNPHVQNDVHIYMAKLMLNECGNDGTEIEKVFKECANFEKRFYKECMKL